MMLEKRMRRIASSALAVTAGMLLCFAAACQAMSSDGISIVNKASLPADRLANAVAAKGILTGDTNLLREAALAAPKNPKYWLLTALFADPLRPSQRLYRARLERSLSIDPTYLPALYAYVASKPTYEQRMRGLRRIAELDSSNGKPYYMMAIELYLHTTEGRRILDRNLEAHEISRDEWRAVVELIREGNSHERFDASLPEPPSGQDLSVRMCGSKLKAADVDAGIADVLRSMCIGDDGGFLPLGFPAAAMSRQIARQADFEARQAYRRGQSAEALDMLRVIKTFALRYASSEPRDSLQISIGCAIRLIADAAEADVLKAMGNRPAARAASEEGLASRRTVSRLTAVALQQTGELWPSAAKRAAKDALVVKTLRELGWERQQAK